MAYRMIIADDEEMLIRLIRKLGHFEKLGIEVIDECRDGEEAYNSILRNKPDFVLTDIQMPVLDGLEMIEKVYQQDENVLFVLLSGYRYFEYAQNAVRLNVVDYLLKPVDEQQLNQILQRLCRLTDERRQRDQDLDSFHQLQNTHKQEKQESFWQYIMAPENQKTGAILSQSSVKEQFEIDLPHKNVQMLFLEADLMDSTGAAAYSFVEKLLEQADNAFDGKAIHYFQKKNYGICFLLNYPPKFAQEVRNAVSVFFYNCKELQENYLEADLTLGVSDMEEMPTSIPRLTEEARAAVWGRYVLGRSRAIRYEQLQNMRGFAVESILTEDCGKTLRDSIHYLRRKELEELFAALETDMQLHRQAHPESVLALYRALRRAVLESVVEDQREVLTARMEKALWQAQDYRDLVRKLHSVLDAYLLEQEKKLEAKNRRPVEQTVDYIRRNFARNLSLETAADAVGLSATYLSKVFKEMTGTGFNEYLTEVRLEESKKLLADSNLSIREVASAVGYADDKYYSKVFKKQLGIKPTEYRKLYG